MVRRWSLIALTLVLSVALAFVIVDLVQEDNLGKQAPAANAPDNGGKPKGVGWWPLDETEGREGNDKSGDHDAALQEAARWSSERADGSVLELDGESGFADTGAQILDTTRDYSVAAWVRLDAPGFRTAVSIDGRQSSVFFLQHVMNDQRFSFSFANARALAEGLGEPQLNRWYHLTGTYTQADSTLRIYVDGELSGATRARNPETPAGNLVIGRGKSEGKPTDFWPGGISDVRAYNRALRPGEVAILATRPSEGR